MKEKEYRTPSWLRCDEDSSKKLIERLWCETCRRFEDKIRRVKNFSPAWISGSINEKVSNVVDHAKMEVLKIEVARIGQDLRDLEPPPKKQKFSKELKTPPSLRAKAQRFVRVYGSVGCSICTDWRGCDGKSFEK